MLSVKAISVLLLLVLLHGTNLPTLIGFILRLLVVEALVVVEALLPKLTLTTLVEVEDLLFLLNAFQQRQYLTHLL